MKTLKELRDDWVECNILYCGEGIEEIEEQIAKKRKLILRQVMRSLNTIEKKLAAYINMQSFAAEYELSHERQEYEKVKEKFVSLLKELI